MSGVQRSSVNMINNTSIRRNLLHYATNVILNKIAFNFPDPTVNQIIASRVASATPELLRGVDHDHRNTDAFGRSRTGKLRLKLFLSCGVGDAIGKNFL